jgi:UDP-glucuronate decarboxylase
MITWITETLGTSSYDAACESSDFTIIDVRDMADKAGNQVALVRNKIRSTVALLREQRKVVICCDYGLSRSNAVAAGVFSLVQGISFDDALGAIISAIGKQSINLEVISTVRKALEEHTPDMEAKKREHLLVTGGTGFVGSHLINRLSPSYTIFAPRKADLDLRDGPVQLNLYLREKQISRVLHLAQPKEFGTNHGFANNLLMMKNVIDACRDCSANIVFLSCLVVFSGYRSELAATESTPPLPLGSYGQAKYLSEVLLKQHSANGFQATIIRTGPIYGGNGEKPKFLKTFIHKALDQQDIVVHKYRNGYPLVDLIHIDDVTAAIERIIDVRLDGIFHLGSGKARSTKAVAQSVVSMTGSKSSIQSSSLDESNANVSLVSARESELPGWRPLVELEDGLSALVSQIRNEKRAASAGEKL